MIILDSIILCAQNVRPVGANVDHIQHFLRDLRNYAYTTFSKCALAGGDSRCFRFNRFDLRRNHQVNNPVWRHWMNKSKTQRKKVNPLKKTKQTTRSNTRITVAVENDQIASQAQFFFDSCLRSASIPAKKSISTSTSMSRLFHPNGFIITSGGGGSSRFFPSDAVRSTCSRHLCDYCHHRAKWKLSKREKHKRKRRKNNKRLFLLFTRPFARRHLACVVEAWLLASSAPFQTLHHTRPLIIIPSSGNFRLDFKPFSQTAINSPWSFRSAPAILVVTKSWKIIACS